MSGECNICGQWGHAEGSCPNATEEERAKWSITKDGFTRISSTSKATPEGVAAMRKEFDERELEALKKSVKTLGDALSDRIQRSVKVEQYLWDAAGGRRKLPDAELCKKLALDLGIPTELRMGE